MDPSQGKAMRYLWIVAVFFAVACAKKTPPPQVEFKSEAQPVEKEEAVASEDEKPKEGEVLFPDATETNTPIAISEGDSEPVKSVDFSDGLPKPTDADKVCEQDSDCGAYNFFDNCCPGCGGTAIAARKGFVSQVVSYCADNKPAKCKKKKCKARLNLSAKCQDNVCVTTYPKIE